MGIPYPPAIKKAIEVLQKRASHIDDEIQEMIDNMEDDISLNTVMTRSLIRKSLNWCRRKSKDEKGSARNTAEFQFLSENRLLLLWRVLRLESVA